MRVKLIALISILSLLLSFILFCSVFFSVIFDLEFYKSEYAKYGLTRFSMDTLINETSNLFGFFKGTAELDYDYFSRNEILHLNDVKNLIDKLLVAFAASFAAFVMLLIFLYKESRKLFLRNAIRVAFATGAAGLSFIVLGIGIHLIFGFDFIFSKFHEIFFIGNYSFNPNISNMKYMFPDGFFLDASIRIISIYAFASFILLLFGAAYITFKKRY